MIVINLFHSVLPVSDSDDLDLQRFTHLKHVCDLDFVDGDILEFGVYQGATINFMAEKFSNKILYGFDSFEGLPEDWNISYKEKFNKHKKGFFSLESLPDVKSNVKLVKGFFDTSLPKWLIENSLKQISLLHIDCDLYSSTKTVFDNLNNYIVPGTIIIFDEFYPWGRKRYETWEEHEYKALCEWVETYNRDFKVLFRSNHQQCSIRITQ